MASSILSFLTVISVIGFILCADPTAESKLITSLLKSYNRYARPTKVGPTTVSAAMTLYQILDIDNRKQEITFTGGFLMNWVDDNLKWVPNLNGKVFLVTLPIDAIWTPDVGLATGTEKAFDFSSILTTRALVSQDGRVYWPVVRVFKSTCVLDMGDFPFDVQTCRLRFHSQTQIENVFQLAPQGLPPTKVIQNDYIPSDEWDLIDATVQQGSVPTPKFDEVTGIFNMSTIDVNLTVARRTGYYWVNLIGPCMMISILVTAVFAMPCDAGEKISFSVTVLLAFTVYQLIVAETLPKTSEITPLLSSYLGILIGLSTTSVALSLVVLHVHHIDADTTMPGWFHAFVFKFLAFITCNCDKSKLLQKAKVSTGIEQSKPVDLYEHLKSSMPDLKQPGNDYDSPVHSEVVAIRELLGAIYRHSVLPKEDRPPKVNEWKMAAAILDRLFLILYLLVTVLVTIALIVPGAMRQAKTVNDQSSQ